MTDLMLVHKTFGTTRRAYRATRTAHLLVPRDGRPGRETILQSEVVLGDKPEISSAKVSVLDDNFAWTVLIELTGSEVVRSACSTTESDTEIERSMDYLSNDLLHSAATILGC